MTGRAILIGLVVFEELSEEVVMSGSRTLEICRVRRPYPNPVCFGQLDDLAPEFLRGGKHVVSLGKPATSPSLQRLGISLTQFGRSFVERSGIGLNSQGTAARIGDLVGQAA
ncbi:hypothetical protein M3A80_009055 [Micrococcus luteus]|nr:hypothetical protein [Micrococcus luteus]